MKVGDLITLSAYGGRLAFIASVMRRSKWQAGKKAQIIGLVVNRLEDGYLWHQPARFSINWIGEEGIPGRDHYNKFFHRKDLKMVSRA